MTNRRKRILFAVVLLVFSLGLAWLLRPRNEPMYQGRYLSEWMEVFGIPNAPAAELDAASRALEQIGTNGLPTYVAWLSQEPTPWKESLFRKLPQPLRRNDLVANWLVLRDARRPGLAMQAMLALSTNAAGAIPQLEYLVQTRTNETAELAIHALAHIGVEAIPVLQTAFTNPKQVQRLRILWCLRWLALSGNTNECMPTIVAALEDQDVNVRTGATNLLLVTTYGELISLPRD